MNKYKLILDVRSSSEILKYGKLKNSVNIEYSKLYDDFINKRVDKIIPLREQVLVYCQSGRRSRQIVWIGNNNGYNFKDLDGGFDRIAKLSNEEWKRSFHSERIMKTKIEK